MKARIAAILCTALAVSGCGALKERQEESNPANQVIDVNMQQAAEQADWILDETLEIVHPHIKWTHGETTDTACKDMTNDAADKGAVLRRRTVMTIISEERRGSFLGIVERYWKKQGFKVTGVNKDKDFPAVYMKTHKGFALSLSFGHKGQAFFEVATPCAETSAVSPPKTEANAPDYSGQQIPPPTEHSEFWSATTPPTPSASGD